MKIVVDTNIIFSALLNSNSNIGQILLKPNNNLEFYSVKFLQHEIIKHYSKIIKYSKQSENKITELIEIIYSKIYFIDEQLIKKETLLAAEKLTYDIDFDDVLFVALALELECRLWTGDMKLSSSLIFKGFYQVISTQDLVINLK